MKQGYCVEPGPYQYCNSHQYCGKETKQKVDVTFFRKTALERQTEESWGIGLQLGF